MMDCILKIAFLLFLIWNYWIDKYEMDWHYQPCIEESCGIVETCIPCKPDLNLEYQYGECVCKSGYSWDPNTRKCIPRPEQQGDSCDNARACDPNEHLECKYGKCACIDGYTLELDGATNSCMKIKLFSWWWKVFLIIFGVRLILALIYYAAARWIFRRRRRRPVRPGDVTIRVLKEFLRKRIYEIQRT